MSSDLKKSFGAGSEVMRLLIWILIFGSNLASADVETKMAKVDAKKVKLEVRINDQTAKINDAKLKVKMFGYHKRWLDNSASLINTWDYPVKQLPFIATFSISRDWYKIINDPAVEIQANARYYFKIYLDSDKNGDICQGDYVQKSISSYDELLDAYKEVLFPSTTACTL